MGAQLRPLIGQEKPQGSQRRRPTAIVLHQVVATGQLGHNLDPTGPVDRLGIGCQSRDRPPGQQRRLPIKAIGTKPPLGIFVAGFNKLRDKLGPDNSRPNGEGGNALGF